MSAQTNVYGQSFCLQTASLHKKVFTSIEGHFVIEIM